MISKYKAIHQQQIIDAISQDPDWACFTQGDALEHYKAALESGVTYVAHSDGEFCGYLRALLDPHFALYISELYVVTKWRNNKIGQALLQKASDDHSELSVYVLSDEDGYYLKKGYGKAGSVFLLSEPGVPDDVL
ncbi:GNAT family N-acetyltransferase [Dongshaea marina]|uniref:GNAT family N-acetyltransferase n=1 Tax=Dongshaea marina TaxID=2047966 RepID=UPI00131F03B1|nr:GNAT family N-acetyltransferase [Dongshaea marina]